MYTSEESTSRIQRRRGRLPSGFTGFCGARLFCAAALSQLVVPLTVKSLIWVVCCPWLVPRGHRFGKKPIPPRMDYLAFGFSDGVGSRSSLSLQNGDQPVERRTSRLWINKLTGRVDDEPASLPRRQCAAAGASRAASSPRPTCPRSWPSSRPRPRRRRRASFRGRSRRRPRSRRPGRRKRPSRRRLHSRLPWRLPKARRRSRRSSSADGCRRTAKKHRSRLS